MSNMEWDGVRLFDVREPPNYEVIPYPVAKCLPSDSRYRPDLVYLKTDTVENAQEQKTELEDKQRIDRKWREAAEKRRKEGGPKFDYAIYNKKK